MKYLFSLMLVCITLITVGCASSSQPVGVLFSTTANGVSANNNVYSDKVGKSCATSILSIVAIGNANVDDAKADGSISKVATVDNSAFNVLGIYGHYCTIVTGE